VKLIGPDDPTVINQEQVPALPGHVFQVALEREDSRIVQFFGSLAMPKWVGWGYEQVPVHERRRFEAQHTAERLSPGLYAITLPGPS